MQGKRVYVRLRTRSAMTKAASGIPKTAIFGGRLRAREGSDWAWLAVLVSATVAVCGDEQRARGGATGDGRESLSAAAVVAP